MKKEYTNKWNFNGIDLESIPDHKPHGFIYLIIDKENGMRYLGKKSFWSCRKLKPTDKRRTTVESDWKFYWSSSPKIKALIKEFGNERFERHIIAICNLERHVNYLEVKYQFKYNILEEPDKWYNDNINGCWYPHLYVDIDEKTNFSSTIDLDAMIAANK